FGAGGAGERGLDALLADLLGDAFGTFGEQAGGPAFGRAGVGARGDGLFQPGEATEAGGVLVAEAAGAVQVAGVADRPDLQQQGVAVAVGGQGDQVQAVARGLALAPAAA